MAEREKENISDSYRLTGSPLQTGLNSFDLHVCRSVPRHFSLRAFRTVSIIHSEPCSNNYITKLKVGDSTLVTPTEILKEELRYHQNLYTSTCTNPNDTCFDKFFESPTLPKLTAQPADTCDCFLTKDECHASKRIF